MDGIIFRLENFEGPLDLLLHLIEKHKIDIYNIPIAELTDSYLEYLDIIEKYSMDNLSEFIVMAAQLIELKSRLLLPKDEEEEENPEDIKEELVRRLVEYKKYKEAAEGFGEIYEKNPPPVFRNPDEDLKKEILKGGRERHLEDILNGADGDMLYKAFSEVMKRKELKVDRVRSRFDHVERDPFTVEEKMEHIKNVLSLRGRVEFGELFGRRSSVSERITTFLALLELMKIKFALVKQESIFGRIFISMREEEIYEAQ